LSTAPAPDTAEIPPVCAFEECENRIPWERWIRSRKRAKFCRDTCKTRHNYRKNPRLSKARPEQLALALSARGAPAADVAAESAPERERNGRRVGPPSPGASKIQMQFERWLEQNPELWSLIRRYAYRALESGRSRFGIAAIVERVRWEVEIEGRGEPFKLTNNYRSRIVRKLIAEEPAFAELFETRRLRS
jgi:hypothetical protein